MVGRIALLVNPSSGGGEAERVAPLLRRDGAAVDVVAIEDAQQLPASSPERLVVAGGDGSLGPAAELAADAGIPLAVVPTGTANDFARALGIPLELDPACAIARHGRRRRSIDLARIGARPYLNVASAGLSPAAAREAAPIKHLGPLAYLLGAARAGILADAIGFTLDGDGERLFTGRGWQVTVASTGAFGAGASLGGADDDGALDAVVIEAGSRLRLLRHAYGMRSGTLRRQPGVRCWQAREVAIDSAAALEFNVDGEIVRWSEVADGGPVRFSVEPRAVSVLVG